eukprot:TRINITY_DN7530_c0_g1_i1.p1 TRINITY_DN7530_c0_g1~~TRINITY_DN7530_c0_g1_i1.p1  ORF type:complete len:271 (+),score=58.02 TRINITY_DN7530_c0_g1_i1:54-815(+)
MNGPRFPPKYPGSIYIPEKGMGRLPVPPGTPLTPPPPGVNPHSSPGFLPRMKDHHRGLMHPHAYPPSPDLPPSMAGLGLAQVPSPALPPPSQFSGSQGTLGGPPMPPSSLQMSSNPSSQSQGLHVFPYPPHPSASSVGSPLPPAGPLPPHFKPQPSPYPPHLKQIHTHSPEILPPPPVALPPVDPFEKQLYLLEDERRQLEIKESEFEIEIRDLEFKLATQERSCQEVDGYLKHAVFQINHLENFRTLPLGTK